MHLPITVVIPAKDEAKTISQIIKSCMSYTDDILVVDGNSSDDTARIASGLGARVIFDDNKGKGNAIRKSLPHINREIVVFIDADGSHDPKDIPTLVQPIIEKQADHITGSRILGGSDELYGSFGNFLRRMGNLLVVTIINKRFNVRLTDSQNGFRAIRSSVLRQLDLAEDSFSIEQEMVIKTLKSGFIVGEVPAHEYERKHGESHIKMGTEWIRYTISLIKNIF